MKVYLDSDFIIHLSPAPGLTEAEAEANLDTAPFYRYVPEGMQWKDPEGNVYDGPMLSPVIDTNSIRFIVSANKQAYREGVNSL